MKDIIEIETNNGSVNMEVVLIYKKENSDYNYIIYRELDKSHYYIAKYIGEEVVDLNTDLTNEELDYGNKILEGIMENARS